jgi:hypothetical protein
MARKEAPKSKLGRSDRYPSDYGMRERDEGGDRSEGKSWSPGDKGQGREGKGRGAKDTVRATAAAAAKALALPVRTGGKLGPRSLVC